MLPIAKRSYGSQKGQGTCETSPGRLEPPTGAMTGEPVLLPVAGSPDGNRQPEEPDGLFELPTEEGIGAQYGLDEIPGGIGVDSCASSSVMARAMLPGYKVKPSAGSQRGQRWGSASGHTITNEGEVTYRFMTEKGVIKRGTTQVGEVKRPLAAVSDMTGANQIVFFCEGEDWVIDRKDPVAEEMVKLAQKAKQKTKMYQHKGTYRVRAWMVPGREAEEQQVKPRGKAANAPFGRQGS